MTTETRTEPAQAQATALPATVPAAAAPKPKRRMRRLLMLALPIALVVGGVYVWASGGRYETTDNAYLHQPKVSIASEASGRLVEVFVRENGAVKAGDVLLRVEPEPYRLALQQAESALASARLSVGQMRASYDQATAQERSAAGEVDYLQGELARQTDLSKKGIASQSSLDTANRDLLKAREALAAAGQAKMGALAALGGDAKIDTDRHPAVLTATAARDKAAYQLAQTEVKAPADGIVSQAASVKPGQFVAAGTPLFALIETGDVWVDANFKETQLTNLAVGQTAEVAFDMFPGREVRATIDSIGAGTGSEFSLLPAQNATGNWVKVTQRVPVRLKLEDVPADIALRTGLSAEVTVDTEVPTLLSQVLGGAAQAKVQH